MKSSLDAANLRQPEPILPPTIIVQGTADDNLPVPVTEQFVAAYREAGGDIEVELFPGMPHMFGNTPGPESDRAVVNMENVSARRWHAGPKRRFNGAGEPRRMLKTGSAEAWMRPGPW